MTYYAISWGTATARVRKAEATRQSNEICQFMLRNVRPQCLIKNAQPFGGISVEEVPP
jgi:hypothetical protein